MAPTARTLRERAALAARRVPLRLGPNALRMAQDGEPIRLSGSEAEAVVAAVLGVEPTDTERLETEFERDNHPEFGAVVVAYWAGGRLELRDVAGGRCVCGRDDLHAGPPRVQATFVDAWDAELPEPLPAWRVRSGAPDEGAARALAREMAKSLGFRLNPILNVGGAVG